MTKHAGRRGDFWSKVLVGADNECWPWLGSVNGDGYGQVRVNKQLFRAHRWAYTLTYGEPPDGQIVRHTCDNRPCCNVNRHLITGTQAENVADMMARQRYSPKWKRIGWSKRPRSFPARPYSMKLNEAKVREIRALWDTGQYTKVALGRRFGVSDTLIGFVVRLQAWAWVA